MSYLTIPRMTGILLCAILMTLSGRAFARDAAPAEVPLMSEQDQIQTVIAGQLEAFRAGDVAQAFSYADAPIQALFGNAQQFGVMVQQGYAPIFTNASYEFGQFQVLGINAVQIVMVLGNDGTRAVAQYRLSKGSGEWRIAGVVMQLI